MAMKKVILRPMSALVDGFQWDIDRSQVFVSLACWKCGEKVELNANEHFFECEKCQTVNKISV